MHANAEPWGVFSLAQYQLIKIIILFFHEREGRGWRKREREWSFEAVTFFSGRSMWIMFILR